MVFKANAYMISKILHDIANLNTPISCIDLFAGRYVQHHITNMFIFNHGAAMCNEINVGKDTFGFHTIVVTCIYVTHIALCRASYMYDVLANHNQC